MGKILLTDGTRKLQRAGRMPMSEIMTIITLFQILNASLQLLRQPEKPANWHRIC